MLDELEWPSLEALRQWRYQSPLLLFHKIHFGAVSIEKDKYMTPALSLKTIRSVILLHAHPASFVHDFVSGMQSFYFSESQDAIVLQTCH